MASENEIEDRISRLLWLGVATAGGLCLLGMMLYAISQPSSQAYSLGGWSVMAGIAILLLTPAARVAMMLMHYVRLRDRDFILITLFVLAMMAFGYFFGAG